MGFIFLAFVAFFILGIVITLKEQKTEERRVKGKKESLQNYSGTFWLNHSLFPQIMSYVNSSIQNRIASAANNTISPNSERYIRIVVDAYKVVVAETISQNNTAYDYDFEGFDFEKKGYNRLSIDKIESLSATIHTVIKKEYGSRFPVTFTNYSFDGYSTHIRIDSVCKRLKNV